MPQDKFFCVYLQVFILVGVTYGSKNDSQTTLSQKPTPVWVTAPKSWEPGANCMQPHRLESVLSKWHSWTKLRGSCAGFCFFQASVPISVLGCWAWLRVTFQLSSSEGDSQQLALFTLPGRGSDAGQFQGLLKYLGLLHLLLREFPQSMENVSVLEETATQQPLPP